MTAKTLKKERSGYVRGTMDQTSRKNWASANMRFFKKKKMKRGEISQIGSRGDGEIHRIWPQWNRGWVNGDGEIHRD